LSRVFLRLVSVIGLIVSLAFHVSSIAIAEDSTPCDTYQVNGGDDYFLMNLNTPLKWGDVIYEGNVYVTPKGTLTFGVGDFTFWDYPQSPSISIGSFDYHAFSNSHPWGIGNDLYIKYGSNSNSFCVEWKVLPWGQNSGTPVLIRLTAQVNPENYEWNPTYEVSSNAPFGARYGARYVQSGTVEPLQITTIAPPEPTPTEEPTVEPTIEPTIEPSPEPTQEPTEEPTVEPPIEPTPEPTIEPSIEPIPEPSPEPTPNPAPNPEPSVQPTPELTPEPTLTPEVTTSPTVEEVVEDLSILEITPTPTPTIVEEIFIEEEVIEEVPQENVGQLEEFGVVLAVIGTEVLSFVGDVAEEVFAFADEAVTDFLNIGDDMSPEVREDAQTIVVSTIIITQIASSVSIGSATRRS
jgi:hypothetical protein